MDWSAALRNGIAAFTTVLALGAPGVKFYTDFLDLQKQVASLSHTVDAIYCKLEPQDISCLYGSGPDTYRTAEARH